MSTYVELKYNKYIELKDNIIGHLKAEKFDVRYLISLLDKLSVPSNTDPLGALEPDMIGEYLYANREDFTSFIMNSVNKRIITLLEERRSNLLSQANDLSVHITELEVKDFIK